MVSCDIEQCQPSRGQEYRDTIRFNALEESGFNAWTLDDKHDQRDASNVTIMKDKHCCASFNDSRRAIRNIRKSFGYIQFNLVILDYFFSPVSKLVSSYFFQDYTLQTFHMINYSFIA